MRVDWLTVARDILGVLVLLFIVVMGGVYAAGGLSLNTAFGLGFVAMASGFCVSGCLSPSSRFKHLPAVALGVWAVGTLLNTITRGFPIEAVWQMGLQSSLPVAGAMLLGGAISLAIVRTPEPQAADAESPADSSSSQG